MPVNALILHYRYRIPTVMLTPWLRTSITIWASSLRLTRRT